jgi:hypothetical protein
MIKKLVLIALCMGCAVTVDAQTKSWKRGACMSNLREADFEALQTGMTWFYDWGTTPPAVGVTASDNRNIEYCPMRWGAGWNPDAIRNYVATHPNCKYLLTFNEPNFKEQANLTPQQAAAYWPEIKALANELGLKIISPALNYSAWAEWGTPKKWLDAFFQLVPVSDVDGIALHCYMGGSSALIGYVKEYIGYYNKPVWLTEFCSWDDRWGTADAEMKKIQREYLVDVFDYLETEPMVARYAWFMAKTGENNAVPGFPWMQLLNGHNGILTENGKIFNNMSSYDDNFYHQLQSRIQANHYIRMKGIHLEETTDVDGIIQVYDYNVGDYLEYNIDVPANGQYYLFLRYSSIADVQVTVQINGNTQTDLTLPASGGNNWATKKYTVNLTAGKQKFRLLGKTGNMRINWLNLTANANAETETGGDGPTPGGHNLALNKPVEASSEQAYGDRLAMYAVDGVIDDNRWATEWEGANPDNDRWFLVDLQKAYSIDRIAIYWEAAYATGYYIEISTDKQQWTTIYETSNGKGGAEELPVSGIGRYVRFKGVTRATQYGVSFYEFEVYGTDATGLNKPDDNLLSVSSNPATGKITIHGNVSQVNVYSLQGQQIMSCHKNELDVSSLPAGLYLVSVTDKTGKTTTVKVQVK